MKLSSPIIFYSTEVAGPRSANPSPSSVAIQSPSPVEIVCSNVINVLAPHAKRANTRTQINETFLSISIEEIIKEARNHCIDPRKEQELARKNIKIANQIAHSGEDSAAYEILGLFHTIKQVGTSLGFLLAKIELEEGAEISSRESNQTNLKELEVIEKKDNLLYFSGKKERLDCYDFQCKTAFIRLNERIKKLKIELLLKHFKASDPLFYKSISEADLKALKSCLQTSGVEVSEPELEGLKEIAREHLVEVKRVSMPEYRLINISNNSEFNTYFTEYFNEFLKSDASKEPELPEQLSRLFLSIGIENQNSIFRKIISCYLGTFEHLHTSVMSYIALTKELVNPECEDPYNPQKLDNFLFNYCYIVKSIYALIKIQLKFRNLQPLEDERLDFLSRTAISNTLNELLLPMRYEVSKIIFPIEEKNPQENLKELFDNGNLYIEKLCQELDFEKTKTTSHSLKKICTEGIKNLKDL